MRFLAFLSNIEIKGIFALVFSVFGYVYECIDISIIILSIFMIFDYITGIAIVFKNRVIDGEDTFDYKKGIFGAIKKLFYFMIITVGFLLDYLIQHFSGMFDANIVTNGLIGTILCFYFIGNEGLSLIENWRILGIDIAEILIDIFQKFKNIKPKE